jgi:diaminohydroxyphosphoribosylaminopyrimidine deaminase/5-amino-6-(5-phosphoribosylamino)uracil reductase
MGRVHPNPMVGCVLVKRGRVVGEGWHHAFGQNHAEVDAIRNAGSLARGAAMYVNLEPCAHWGKTPPCVIAIVASGVRRVIAAMRDPNPQVAGNGLEFLKKHGIPVKMGVMEKEARELNRTFVTWISRGRPFVTLKAAVSLDGKIATERGESRWITGPQARAYGHVLRAEADAVAVGVGTVLKDNPTLTAHGKGRNPVRVIFDSRLRTPPRAKVMSKSAPTWIFTTKNRSSGRGRLFHVSADSHGHLNLKEALRVLAREGVTHLLLEGGGTLTAAFLEAGLVDEAVWFIAPKIIGGKNAKTAVEGNGVARLSQAWNLQVNKVEFFGRDLCLQGSFRPSVK